MTEEDRLKRLEEARNDVDSWKERYRLTPLERMQESMKLWQFYLQAGGSLDPEPDSQSPFDSVMPRSTAPAYGRPGLRVVRSDRRSRESEEDTTRQRLADDSKVD